MRRRLPALMGAAAIVVAGPFVAVRPVTAATDAVRHRITFLVEVPASTPASDPIYVSGSDPALGDWIAAGLRLRSAGERRFAATLAFEQGARIHFKVTRGTWETVEKDARGGEIANREYDVQHEDTVRVVVATWRDQQPAPPPRASTITGDVRLHPDFPSAVVAARDVRVWLPPGYEDDRAVRYPVLYFHDGQNVLDAATSFIGVEWGLDETATRLIRAGTLRPFIAVCVSNTSARTAEYTPAADPRHGGGRAPDYARFLIEELKPFVDRTYRTLPDPAHTGSVGSSLGAVAALWLGLERPQTFGLAGCVSPAAWWADRDLVARVPRRLKGLRVWMDIGGEEGSDAEDRRRTVEDARTLAAALAAAGLHEGEDLHFEVVEGGRHNERDWAARLDRILLFLLGPPPGRPAVRHD